MPKIIKSAPGGEARANPGCHLPPALPTPTLVKDYRYLITTLVKDNRYLKTLNYVYHSSQPQLWSRTTGI